MLQAILFDLDDTLLGNHMDNFMPGYFSLISQYAQDVMDKKQFLQELMICTQYTVESTDLALTNRDVFWQAFEQRNGMKPAELEPFFEQFYRTQFPQLRTITQFRPAAAKLIKACQERELQVVIATNPLFPQVAIEERLAWAGVPVTEFDYALVTTYENMHATKPHKAYYREILQNIACAAEAALMVGDSWEMDIVPAAEVGMYTYWLPGGEGPQDGLQSDGETAVSAQSSYPTAQGSLDDLYALVQQGWLDELPRLVEQHDRTTTR